METFVLLTITGLGLGALYFLIASGLSLIYGLMGVLNFAHGAFLTVGAYFAWWSGVKLEGTIDSTWLRFLVSVLIGLAVGAALAALVELVLIRPLYLRHIEQVLVTVGLSFALDRARTGVLGADFQPITSRLDRRPRAWAAPVPNHSFVRSSPPSVSSSGCWRSCASPATG